jgi:transcriptional regulator with GAF, ATPase, and Fis domain
MLLNTERNGFQTAAIYQRRRLLWDERTIAGLPLDELYTHRKVITTGKPIVITDLDSKLRISDFEARLLMPEGISQCMITPIIIDGKTMGVVTIGENRKAERTQIGMHKIVFGLLLTNLISMILVQMDHAGKRKKLLDSNRMITRKLANIQNRAETFDLINGFNSRLNGPLAGILASCEYLKSRPQLNREEYDRYVNLINRNASKIHKLSGQFAEARRAVESVIGV